MHKIVIMTLHTYDEFKVKRDEAEIVFDILFDTLDKRKVTFLEWWDDKGKLIRSELLDGGLR